MYVCPELCRAVHENVIGPPIGHTPKINTIKKRKIINKIQGGDMIARSLLVLLASAVVLSGCSGYKLQFHNKSAADLSARLQTEFAAYRQDQPSIYANMAANLQAFQAEEEELLSRFVANFHDALVTKVPTLTRLQLQNKIAGVPVGGNAKRRNGGLKNRINVFNGRLLDELGEAAKQKRDAAAVRTAAGEKISDLKKDIKEKQAAVAEWNKKIETYQTAIADLPTSVEGLAEKATGLSSLLAAVKEVSATLKADKKFSADEIKSISDLLAKVPADLKTKLGAGLAESPGIAVRILELGLELAVVEKKKAEHKLAEIEQRRNYIEEAFIYTRTADILIAEICGECIAGKWGNLDGWNKRENAASDILLQKRAAAGKPSETIDTIDSISLSLTSLRRYATAEWLVRYQESMLPVRLRRLEHQQSISVSQRNDEARQAVIASGVDALAAYHKGGVTEEDIANLVRLAQSIALFIIAA